eukprot:CAMPEP_0194544162 /NCGR_PEP_ID=MMETSP0253-20130528/87057_1 /TAXON_ID=2966 /ORGANISM="Noctiluca scintillans" /LENGTH=74 /DNA_ID=CAMNT_0039391011 /DNA_START=44 /DNA_END=269 /DNA_ORIENTATION=+
MTQHSTPPKMPPDESKDSSRDVVMCAPRQTGCNDRCHRWFCPVVQLLLPQERQVRGLQGRCLHSGTSMAPLQDA